MVTTRQLTVAEFEAMPLEGRWELIDGEPVEGTPSSGPSSRFGGRIYARILAHVEPTGMGLAYPADALAKIAMYLQAGVQLAWLVDPDSRTVTVFQADAPIQTFSEGDDLDFGEVIPGLRTPVIEIFA